MSSSLRGRDGYVGIYNDEDGGDNNDDANVDSQDDCRHSRGGSRQENSRWEVNCAGKNSNVQIDTYRHKDQTYNNNL